MRAVLIGNRDDADPGLVGEALRRRGCSFTVSVREEPTGWQGTEGFDLVLSLGSSWSAYWPEVAAETGAETAYLAGAMARGVPVLGICFGGQLLAATLGGIVERSQMHEIGWHQVDTVAGSGRLGAETLAGQWFQWHYDRFSVPPGATELAASPVSPQAFLFGRSLGLQFHPEVDLSIVEKWSTGEGADELARAGINRDLLLARTETMVADAAPRTEALVDWFLERMSAPAQAHENQH